MRDEQKNWRFMIDNEGNVLRGRAYKMGDEDSWTHYWDGDSQVAFYDEGYRGFRVVTGTDIEAGERAIKAARESADMDDALTKVARRITGQPDSCFIAVGLDRGIDLYALAWAGDESGDWAREIEAVWNHEVYRCETEQFYPYLGANGQDMWLAADDMCEEWYGEDKADAAMLKTFPLDAFPAEHFITGSD